MVAARVLKIIKIKIKIIIFINYKL